MDLSGQQYLATWQWGRLPRLGVLLRISKLHDEHTYALSDLACICFLNISLCIFLLTHRSSYPLPILDLNHSSGVILLFSDHDLSPIDFESLSIALPQVFRTTLCLFLGVWRQRIQKSLISHLGSHLTIKDLK